MGATPRASDSVGLEWGLTNPGAPGAATQNHRSKGQTPLTFPPPGQFGPSKVYSLYLPEEKREGKCCPRSSPLFSWEPVLETAGSVPTERGRPPPAPRCQSQAPLDFRSLAAAWWTESAFIYSVEYGLRTLPACNTLFLPIRGTLD